MDTRLNKNILWAYFEGRATSIQKQLILEWLQSETNREIFYRMLHEWEKENLQFQPNIEEDFKRLTLQLSEPTPQFSESPLESIHKSPIYKIWIAAASVILLLIGCWWAQDFLLYKTYTTGFGQIQTLRLPDDSRVVLNANSTLQVPRFAFLSNHREVKLSGEAEFSVVHTIDHRRFFVHTPDHLEVEVLGTEFLVYSRGHGSKVALSHGKVKLRHLKHQKSVDIRPGDVITVNVQGHFHLQPQQNITEQVAWKEHRFVFNRTPLIEIARKIQEQFGVTVQIPDSALAMRQLSGNYPATNAEELLQMMTRLLDLQLQRLEESVVVLSEK
ncbi:FecR domain-containing protein [Runella sp. MFBS21]|uniref:FecR family protein n=1 Tax=Runella sp. MFBS21 TaxID=3034018 RepID=UPI0023F73A30|nr:FecR domain-containing protein [Runella sp. MFBS21]MDF7815980.1 FecR domain-containing protein [Runella sp. MFBS21]